MKTVLVGVPGTRRPALWQEALRDRGWQPAEEISYLDVISGAADVPTMFTADAVIRLESPDDDLETNAAILALGEPLLRAEGGRPIGEEDARKALAERGRVVHPRQWFLGFRKLMGRIQQSLMEKRTGAIHESPPRRVMNEPGLVSVLYDKQHSASRLLEANVPTPPAGRAVRDYDDLRPLLDEALRGRVMVKLRHGSAAAGAVAIEKHKDKMRALTTAELVDADDGPRVYLTRRIRTLHGEAEIARLIDAMAPWRLHAEAWLPKDRWFDGRRYDLRVLTIAGEPCHAVARLSRSPFTNLNLLNERADAGPLRERDWWPMVEDVCRRTARVFSGAFHLGIDVLATPHGRDLCVLEANAFGDLLPGVLHNGLSTYEAELAALEAEAA